MFERIGWVIFVASTALAIIASTPFSWMPFAPLKLAIVAVGIALSVLSLALARFCGAPVFEPLRASRVYAALVGLLPLAYLVSYALASDRYLGFMGVGSEVDTVFFVVLAYVAFVLGLIFVHSAERARTLLRFVIAAIGLAVAFQYVSILFGSALWSGTVFSDKTVNLIGKWNDLGMAVALVMLLMLVRAEFGRSQQKRWRMAACFIAALLLLGLLVVIGFSLIWWFLGVGAFVIALIKYFRARALKKASSGVSAASTEAVPEAAWYAYGVIVISAIFIMWGAAIGAKLPSLVSVTSLDVRPSISTTYDIARSATGDSMQHTLFGTGPNTFGTAWLRFKPVDVNTTQFWSVDFVTGFSVMSTALVSVGFAGLIAWVLPLLLLCLMFVRVWRTWLGSESDDRSLVIEMWSATIFVWAVLAGYSSSQNMVLLAFALFGALAGFVSTQHVMRTSELKPIRPVGKVLMAIMIIAVIIPAFLAARRSVALAYQGLALNAVSQNDIDGAAQAIATSQGIERTTDNMRTGAEISLAQLQQLADEASSSPSDITEIRNNFQKTLVSAIQQGQTAAQLSVNDYRPYVDLARIYEFLYPLKIQGAYDGAYQAYQQAIKRDPTNPTLPLLLARLEATDDLKGNLNEVQKLITQSLQLKSNYTDAFLLSEQVEVAQNNLPEATRAIEAAVQSAPDQAPLWLELGLLNYSAGNMQNAIPALEQAVALVPSYANAKYFLGLAYYKQGRAQDAIDIFTQIQKDNPTNTDVAHILQNMRWGIDPFAGSKSYTKPVTASTTPLSR